MTEIPKEGVPNGGLPHQELVDEYHPDSVGWEIPGSREGIEEVGLMKEKPVIPERITWGYYHDPKPHHPCG